MNNVTSDITLFMHAVIKRITRVVNLTSKHQKLTSAVKKLMYGMNIVAYEDFDSIVAKYNVMRELN